MVYIMEDDNNVLLFRPQAHLNCKIYIFCIYLLSSIHNTFLDTSMHYLQQLHSPPKPQIYLLLPFDTSSNVLQSIAYPQLLGFSLQPGFVSHIWNGFFLFSLLSMQKTLFATSTHSFRFSSLVHFPSVLYRQVARLQLLLKIHHLQ